MSKDLIAVAVLAPDRDRATVQKIVHDEQSVRKLIGRFEDRSKLWACYEAGPTGYDLYRLLGRLGVRCEVIAPSLVPRAHGDRVKTDKRDARKLAGLHRAGQLTAIAVPSRSEEAIRDLCRTRGDIVGDRTRARNRLTKFLLRHSIVWCDGSNWTRKHQQWLNSLHFEDRALAVTFRHYRANLELRDAQLAAVEEDLRPFCEAEPFGPPAHRLGAYRGVTHMGGLGLAAEVFDWRRFPAARSFMCFTGLVPSEDSSGLHEHRGHITHAGNRHLRAQLVEAAWAYQHRPHVGSGIAARHADLPPEVVARAWNAQVRLNRRFLNLARRKNVRSVVAAAIARELAGFLWAEMNTN